MRPFGLREAVGIKSRIHFLRYGGRGQSLEIRHVGVEEAEGIDLRQELRAEGV